MFTFVPHDQPSEEVDFDEDRYFYFGLRVFLEHAPTTFPKEAFWFLFRGRFDGSRFFVTEDRTQREFDVGFDPLLLDPLCDHLFELLKTNLSKSPMVTDFNQPRKIGFITHTAD